jgi:hypothetical protein
MEQTLCTTFSPAIYNSLPCVEDADKRVNQNDALPVFLDEANQIFHTHNMHDRYGVALLHKHYECGDSEHVIQYEEIVGCENALVTRPVHAVPSREDAVPVVWSLIDGTYRPLEYTTDSLARELYGSANIPQAFLEDFADFLRVSPIGCQIGLAVVNRKLYINAPASLRAVEFSELDRSSVVYMRDRDEYKDRIIQTAWNFATAGGPGCNQTCNIDNLGRHYGHHMPVSAPAQGPGCVQTCLINASGNHVGHHKPG